MSGGWRAQSPADLVLLPGMLAPRADVVIAALERYRIELSLLRRQWQQGAMIAANCASTFLLAEAGLLDGRLATTSWWLANAFRERYPRVDLRPDEMITDEGSLLCSGATTAAVHLALHLVERFGAQELAQSVAKFLLIDTNQLSQAPYKSLVLPEHLIHGDPLVKRAQRWMERNLKRPIDLEQVARELCVSERTLIRRFKLALNETPGRYLQMLRIDAAKRMLDRSMLAIDLLCAEVGYEDASSFRRLFRRETGLTPSEYHRRFGRAPARARGA